MIDAGAGFECRDDAARLRGPAAVQQRADLDIPRPFLVFMGDIADVGSAKTGLGLVDWRPDWCAGQWRMPGCGVDLGIAEMSPEQAMSAGVQTVLGN